MTKRIYSYDKNVVIDKVFEKTVITFFKKFFHVQNPFPQFCSHRSSRLFLITFLTDTKTNRKAEMCPVSNDICTNERNDLTKNRYNNFLAYLRAPHRNPQCKFNGIIMSSMNSKKLYQHSLQFKKNDRFLNIFELFSKIMQQMKGESKEQLEENWGGPEAFKLITFLKDDFNNVVKKSPSVLVFFSARWCLHCQQLRKPFGKAALMAKKANLPTSFATLDVNSNPDIADANDVVGIPILKYYKDGKFISNYKGKRTAEAIFEFVKNPPRKATTEESLEL